MSITGAAERGRRRARRALLFTFGVFLVIGLLATALAVTGALEDGRSGAELAKAFIPGILALVGAIGLVAASRRRSSEAPPRQGLAAKDAPAARAGAVMKPAVGRLGRFAAMTAVAIFWNGIVSIFLVEIMRSFSRGSPEWLAALFLIPFVVIGLIMMGAVLYYFLALFNPEPRVTLTPAELRLGGTARVDWEILGNHRRIDTLTLTLEGREEAEYRRGTDTVTARSTFARLPVGRGDRYGGVQRGSALLDLPAATMHSFSSPHNKILWVLKVHGDIKLWPDVDEELPVEVLPPAPQAATAEARR